MKTFKIVIISVICGIAIAAIAKETLSEKERSLVKQRNQLQLQMHQLRVELIKSDPDLAYLHKRIVAMHKELGIKIDSKPEMKRLYKKIKKVELEIDDIKAKKKAAEK